MKKVLTLLPVVLLTACGGGGGGSSSGNESTGNNDDSRNSGNVTFEPVKVGFSLSQTSSTAAEVKGYAEDSNSNFVLLGKTDQLVITADGTKKTLALTKHEIVEGSGSYGGEYYKADVSALASEYVVSWQCDGIEKGSITVNELPLPFEPLVSFAGEVIDISWAPEAEHSYRYIYEGVYCQSASEVSVKVGSPDIALGEDNLDSGHYSKSLSSIFGQTQAELTQGYDSCYFEMEIVGTKNSHETLTSGDITLNVDQTRTIRINL